MCVAILKLIDEYFVSDQDAPSRAPAALEARAAFRGWGQGLCIMRIEV